ncbi:hypothetical protein LP316_01610 [Thalassotalea sp. LPB0316]|uniref:hypothetical protein n=1 Tax=Thalassotalea sp. LPB0316 TaxID=2769490 RepID=UPI0018695565|nr:hypothetical protein [Thalassotalea sp. LPB0316]QOL26031.1 hypothetical protein LP316_01610 [Thalassotalea sp. LPB0316]
MNRIIALCLTTAFLAGCSTTPERCEDPQEVEKQVQQCNLLRKQMQEAKGQPMRLQELERRFQTDCVESRYYRDNYEDKVCKKAEK